MASNFKYYSCCMSKKGKSQLHCIKVHSTSCVTKHPIDYKCCVKHLVVQCISQLHIGYCIMCIAYCVLLIVHHILCILYCIMHIAHCILCIVYCVLHIAFSVFWLTLWFRRQSTFASSVVSSVRLLKLKIQSNIQVGTADWHYMLSMLTTSAMFVNVVIKNNKKQMLWVEINQ